MFKVKDFDRCDLKILWNISKNAFRKNDKKKSLIEFEELVNNSKGKVIVLENEVVGAVFFKELNIPEEVKIESLFITPKYQNKGLGYFILNYLKEDGVIKKIELDSDDSNFKTKKFCEKIKKEM
ncbi:MAG: GNAT family N-acetyltransferase [Cetobacterium sp.]